MPIDPYLPIREYMVDDSFAPTQSKERLQKFDNYQIYSLIGVDLPLHGIARERQFGGHYIKRGGGGENGVIVGINPFSVFLPDTVEIVFDRPYTALQWLAVQTYDPIKPTIDYISIITNLFNGFKPRNYSIYYTQALTTSTKTIYEPAIVNGMWQGLNHSTDYESLLSQVDYLNNSDLTQFTQVIYEGLYTDVPVASFGIYMPPVYYWTIRADYTQHGTQPLSELDHLTLVTGYAEDPRLHPLPDPVIVPSISETFTISYYRQNKLESVQKLVTLDWRFYTLEAVKGQPMALPLIDVAFGSLTISSNYIKALLPVSSSYYNWSDYYIENMDATWNYWVNIYNSQPSITADMVSTANAGNDFINGMFIEYQQSITRVLAANNNYWHNDSNAYSDLNVLNNNHPFFAVSNAAAYEWHIEEQINNKGIGSLYMDSPRTIEIHNALNAGKWGRNPDNPNTIRVWNLGEMIYSIAKILGLRRKIDGTIDRAEEKAKYNPKILNNPQYAEGDYGVTCWGKYGMVVPRLITEYDGSGQLKQPYHVLYDIPQLVRAMQSDADTALSLQHGTEIRTRNIDGNIGKYPNQLALILDMHRRTQAIELYSQRSYNLNTVSSAEIRGLYGGLGIPVLQGA